MRFFRGGLQRTAALRARAIHRPAVQHPELAAGTLRRSASGSTSCRMRSTSANMRGCCDRRRPPMRR